MRSPRISLLLLVLIAVVAVSWLWQTRHHGAAPGHITIYYTKLDGRSEVPWSVSMRAPTPGESTAEYLRDMVLYAATQALTGPPPSVPAIRFPSGTHVLSASVTGSTAVVDLSGEAAHIDGDLAETGAFKSLVWTLTGLPGLDAVAVTIQGRHVNTLPAGQLELDEPLRRSDW